MKLLYFHQHFGTPQGASGLRSYRFARALARRGHEVTVICGSYDRCRTGLSGPFENGLRRGRVDDFDVIELDLPYSNSDGFLRRMRIFLRYAWRCVGLALRLPADLVFATSTPLTAALPGLAAAWLRRKPFIFEVRDPWPELPKAMGVVKNPLILAAAELLEWLAYRSARACVGLSPGITAHIVGHGVPAERVRTLSNGCALDIFSPQPEARNPGRGLLAVYTGAHGRANGLDALLAAAEELRRRGRTDIRIQLVGDGSEKPRLQAAAAAAGLDNLEFSAPLPKAELAALLGRADAGLQILDNVPAFYQNTSPNKFFDYLAAGLPVVCNYPGWLAEMIRARDCGLAVKPEDPGALASALIELADHPEKRVSQGRNARRLGEEQFSWDELEKGFVELIETTASRV